MMRDQYSDRWLRRAVAAGAMALAAVAASAQEPAPAGTLPGTDSAPAAGDTAATDAAAVNPAPAARRAPAPYGGLGLSFGTTGFGVDYRYALNRFVDLRGGYQFGSYQHRFDQDGNRYDGKLQIHAATLMADIKPFAGGFRLSAGLYTGTPAVKLARTGTGTIKLNGSTYNTAADFDARGSIDLGHSAPYAGLGWGGTANGSGFGARFDLGVLLTKAPAVGLSAKGHACDATVVPGCDPNAGLDVGSNATFQADLASERAKIEHDAKNYRYWPVINLGLVYRF